MNKKRFQKIYIEITNICNLNCKFCPETTRKKQFMEISEFEKIIQKVNAYTNLIYLHVKGEPLLHPNLEQILKICEDNKIRINLTTNGVLLAQNLSVLKQSTAIRQINISVHSATQNVQIVTTEYLKYIFEAVRNLSNIYISYRLWNLEDIKNNSQNIELLEMIGQEYGIQDLVKKAQAHKFIKLRENVYLNQDKQFKWPNIKGEFISNTGYCRGLKDQIAILVNGDVVPCCIDQEGDIKLGNIHINTIDEILESNKAKELIENFQNNKLIHPLCKRCGFRTRFENA